MEIERDHHAWKGVLSIGRQAVKGGLQRLVVGAMALSLGSGLYLGSEVKGNPITVTSQLPRTNLVADGTTVYQMNVHVDSTVELSATDWAVYVPLDRFTLMPPPLQPQIPTTNDYFAGWAMDPGTNFVESIIDANWVLSNNARNTNCLCGPAGSEDLENIYFTVNPNAPLGPVTCQNCVGVTVQPCAISGVLVSEKS